MLEGAAQQKSCSGFTQCAGAPAKSATVSRARSAAAARCSCVLAHGKEQSELPPEAWRTSKEEVNGTPSLIIRREKNASKKGNKWYKETKGGGGVEDRRSIAIRRTRRDASELDRVTAELGRRSSGSCRSFRRTRMGGRSVCNPHRCKVRDVCIVVDTLRLKI